MSKKMKFWTAGALGVMMAGLIGMNAYALEDKDIVGTWYVNSMSLDGENTFHPGMMKMEMTSPLIPRSFRYRNTLRQSGLAGGKTNGFWGFVSTGGGM